MFRNILEEVANNREKILIDFFKAYLAEHPEIKSVDEIELVEKISPDSITFFFRKREPVASIYYVDDGGFLDDDSWDE